MSNNTKPLPFYKDLLYYTALIAVVGMVLTAYSIIENNASSNLMIPSIFLVSIFGIMTYYMWYTRCPHCKRPFVKTEDKSKEKDLGVKDTPTKIKFVYKTKNGIEVGKDSKEIRWPAHIKQKFFYCKKCEYGKNNEWSEEIVAEWKDKDKLAEKYPSVILVKKNENGKYVPISKNNAKGNNKTTNKLVSIINFLESKSYSEVRDEEEFEKLVVTLLKNDNHKVLRQKSKGRFRPDILVDDKYPIELKLVENNISPLQRLVGQINDYKTNYKEVGVFILVDQNSKLLQYVSDRVRELNKKSGIFAVSKTSVIRRKTKSSFN